MQPAATAGSDPKPHHQQWIAVQYRPPPMLLPPQMMPPPPPPAPPRFVHYRHQAPSPMHQRGHHHPPPDAAATEDNRTIWIGDLQYWMEENYLHSCFGHTGEVISFKVIRNKQSGMPEGYGFIEFATHSTAEKVLQTFGGLIMPNTDQPFRLNWASFNMGDKRSELASDHSIFVGDLASDVTDILLQETFASRYPSVRGAKVVMDANTGRSKGYGFVRFGNDNEKTLAMTEMNGVYCSSRPMRIGAATPRKSSGGFGSNGSSAHGSHSDGESSNTTIFVGGLDPNVSEDVLRQTFSDYGDIASVKIPIGKQCGFVQFVNRNSAEEALRQLNGKVIGQQTVRLSWGRTPANKQLRSDFGQPWMGMYYGGQFYDGYGYGSPFPSPGMYGPVYGTYPLYVNQQQVN